MFHEAFKSILRFLLHIKGRGDIITNTYTAQVTEATWIIPSTTGLNYERQRGSTFTATVY